MKVTEVRTKESTKHCCGNGCPQSDEYLEEVENRKEQI